MYHRMEDADKQQICWRRYTKLLYVATHKAKDIFEKYMTKHGLSETQAWNLLNTMQDQTSMEELLNALRNKDSDKTKQELLRELEAPAYRVRIERLQDLLQQVDRVMQEVYQQEQLFDTSFFQNLSEAIYYRSIYNIQKQTGIGIQFLQHQSETDQTGTLYELVWKPLFTAYLEEHTRTFQNSKTGTAGKLIDWQDRQRDL